MFVFVIFCFASILLQGMKLQSYFYLSSDPPGLSAEDQILEHPILRTRFCSFVLDDK